VLRVIVGSHRLTGGEEGDDAEHEHGHERARAAVVVADHVAVVQRGQREAPDDRPRQRVHHPPSDEGRDRDDARADGDGHPHELLAV